MDLSLSEQQEMLRKTARDFFQKECPKSLVREMAEDEKGYSPDLWHKMAELGWMGLVFPTEYGGAGADFLDLALLLEEMGRACLPGPFFSTVVLCGLTILAEGSEEQRQEFLTGIARGELILAFALTEPSARYEASAIATRAVPEHDGYVINGTKLFVNDAHIADYVLCAARSKKTGKPEEGITLFLVSTRSPGIECTPLRTMAFDKQCEVVFNNAKVGKKNILGKVNQGWRIVERTLQQAAVARCADMVGSARSAFELSVSYAKERVQFGRPIGSFQAIQHHCANMVVDIDGSAFITYEAAWRLSQGLSSTMLVSMAKAWVNEACQRVTLLGHQIHGGISFCEDHDMHLFHRRVRAGALTLGDTAFHQRVVARELLRHV